MFLKIPSMFFRKGDKGDTRKPLNFL
jgi:hypothetical protein